MRAKPKYLLLTTGGLAAINCSKEMYCTHFLGVPEIDFPSLSLLAIMNDSLLIPYIMDYMTPSYLKQDILRGYVKEVPCKREEGPL